MRQKAQAEAEQIVRNANRQIQMETARALQQIRHEAADLSVMIASKLIQRNLSKEDNERLNSTSRDSPPLTRWFYNLDNFPTRNQ